VAQQAECLVDAADQIQGVDARSAFRKLISGEIRSLSAGPRAAQVLLYKYSRVI
jgi:hypothetical protein